MKDDLHVVSTNPHLQNLALHTKHLFISKEINSDEVIRLKRLITFMGGTIADELTASAHYFISEDVWSVETAKEIGVEQVMQIQWITKLWEVHQSASTIDQKELRQIETSYRVPIFYNLTIAVTGFKANVTQCMQESIERNKGVFSKAFNRKVDILIVNSEAVDNEKHRLAASIGKLTVSEQWLHDCINTKGYAINVMNRADRRFYVHKPVGPFNSTLNAANLNLDQSNVKGADFGCDLSRLSTNDIDETVGQSSRSSRHSVRESNASLASLKSTKSEFALPKKPKQKANSDLRKTISSATTMKVEKPKIVEKFLAGKTVFIPKKDDTLINKIIECGATLVEDSTDEVDYVIVPSLIKPKLPMTFSRVGEMVNYLWINECAAANSLVEIEMHHRLIDYSGNGKKILKDEIFTCSGYPGAKRSFIKALIEHLGGHYENDLKKSNCPILICPHPQGVKYESSISWNYAVLTLEWLLACCENQMRMNELPYLIGDAKASAKNIVNNEKRSSIVPSSQEMPDFGNYSEPAMGSEDIENQPVNRNAISLNSPADMKSKEQKVRELFTKMQTPEKRIASRILKDYTNTPPGSSAAMALKNEVQTEENEVPIKFFDDESPETTKARWERIKALDKLYLGPPAAPQTPPLLEVEEPYEVRRYLFFKSRISDYDSPDPRPKYKAYQQQNEAGNLGNSVDQSNFLAIQSDVNQLTKEFEP